MESTTSEKPMSLIEAARAAVRNMEFFGVGSWQVCEDLRAAILRAQPLFEAMDGLVAAASHMANALYAYRIAGGEMDDRLIAASDALQAALAGVSGVAPTSPTEASAPLHWTLCIDGQTLKATMTDREASAWAAQLRQRFPEAQIGVVAA